MHGQQNIKKKTKQLSCNMCSQARNSNPVTLKHKASFCFTTDRRSILTVKTALANKQREIYNLYKCFNLQQE